MPVTFQDSDIRRSEGLWMALPEDLQVDPEMNGRHELPDIEWLIQDLLLPHGQIQPVSIRKTAGKPVLTAGFSRYRAVAEINKRKLTPEPLRLHCRYTQLDDRQAFIANISENRVRNPTTMMDDAYNLQRLVNVYQMSEKAAAEVYRATVPWVRERRAMLELAPEAVQAVKDGRVKPSAAKAIGKLSRELQKKITSKPGKITTADVAKEAPIPAKADKQSPVIDRAVRKAIEVILAECKAQPDVMVYEIHRDNVMALRAALEGK
jgi:ParB family transcriptional regulator, chromosome partitioning protein